MKSIILMADVMDSHLKDQKDLMFHLKDLVRTTNNKFRDCLLSPLTITLGDEFQGIVKTVSDAVRIIIFFEEELINRKEIYTLRYIVNQGEIETEINSNIAFEMLGQGLTDARKMLNSLKEKKHRFMISLDNLELTELLQHAFKLFETIITKWKSDADKTLVSHFLIYKDYKKIADMMHKERSLIWKREKSLQIESYNSIKRIIQLALNIAV